MDFGQKIYLIYRINCLRNHFWDLFEKTPFSIFWGPKFGRKAGFSSMYASISIVGDRYGDFRVVQILGYACFLANFGPKKMEKGIFLKKIPKLISETIDSVKKIFSDPNPLFDVWEHFMKLNPCSDRVCIKYNINICRIFENQIIPPQLCALWQRTRTWSLLT